MKIGFALGSGSARGYAHIAVIKTLEEHNIKPDYIAGTSIGAAIGAYYALHKEMNSLISKIKSMKKMEFLKLVDLNNPKISLIKGIKIKKFLEENFFKDRTFKDTKIPLTICATDITHKKAIYFEKGRLIDAVMASISIPGIFPPYKINNTYYIDGGVFHPIPYQILLKKGMDKVIGVNLNTITAKENKNMNVFHILIDIFSIMMNEIQKAKNTKKVFILNPVFNLHTPADSFKFYELDKFYQPGEEIIKNKIKELKRWLNQ